MSRYTVVNRGAKKQKKRKLLRRLVSFLVVAIMLSIVLALWIYWRSMTPTILDIAETRLRAETTLAVNEAVCVILSDVDSYSDFFTIEKNSQNEIVMISANSAIVNTFARNTAILSQQKIHALKSFKIDIPIGTLSGVPLLAEKGPTVDVIVSPIGNVSCTFKSVFETAGINQTLHRIYVDVCSNVDLIMPTSHMEVQTITPILISESLIVGKVPETFLQGGLVLGSA